MPAELIDRIVTSPDIMAGKPVIRGTRIPVEMIVRMVAQGISTDEILSDYPRLTHPDVQAALWYAADVLTEEDVFPLTFEPA